MAGSCIHLMLDFYCDFRQGRKIRRMRDRLESSSFNNSDKALLQPLKVLVEKNFFLGLINSFFPRNYR